MTNRILTDAQADLAVTFSPEMPSEHHSWQGEDRVHVDAKLRAILTEQDRVSYEAGRQDAAKEILAEIEKHLREYQWISNPDFDKRYYPYCPTDFEALKAKYLKPEIKL
jgi:hypothetical protein